MKVKSARDSGTIIQKQKSILHNKSCINLEAAEKNKKVLWDKEVKR